MTGNAPGEFIPNDGSVTDWPIPRDGYMYTTVVGCWNECNNMTGVNLPKGEKNEGYPTVRCWNCSNMSQYNNELSTTKTNQCKAGACREVYSFWPRTCRKFVQMVVD